MPCGVLHREIKSLPLYVELFLFFFLCLHVESIACEIVFHKLPDIMIECFLVNSYVFGWNIAPAFKDILQPAPFQKRELHGN